MKKRLTLSFSALAILLSFISIKAYDKLTAEEIITKHLDSIASKEKRDEIKNQLAIGSSEFMVLRVGSSKNIGNAVIVSEAGKVLFGTKFNSNEYPAENISFDGNSVGVAFISPGLRSPFGNFVFNNKQIFSEGLIGGSLSSSWAMHGLSARKARVELGGIKKIDGREVYLLEYLPKRGSDMTIKLYFDTKTFQHLRTEYRQTFSAAQGKKPEESSKQLESRQILTEDFSDYSAENGLNLPHKYRVHLLLDGRGTSEFEWKFEFVNFMFNQKLDAKSFNINTE